MKDLPCFLSAFKAFLGVESIELGSETCRVFPLPFLTSLGCPSCSEILSVSK